MLNTNGLKRKSGAILVPTVSLPVFGPHQPRLSRERKKSWISSQDTAVTYRSWNGVTREIIDDFSVHSGPLYGHSLCVDTVRNKAYGNRQNIIDDGGELTVQKSTFTRSTSFYDSLGGSQDISILRNTQVVGDMSITWPTYSTWEGNQLFYPFSEEQTYGPLVDLDRYSQYMAQAYNMLRPAKRDFTGLEFVAEIRDIPKLIKLRLEKFRDIASFKLAVDFGFTPLVADIKKMLTITSNLNRRVEWLKANQGKPLRRRVRILNERVSDVLYDEPEMICYNTSPPSGQPRTMVTRTKADNMWASGEYVFYMTLDGLYSAEKDLGFVLKLLGAKATPAAIYNAIPFTWLVDWFGNFGDLLEAKADDVAANQFSTYNYIMHHTEREYQVSTTDGYLRPTLCRNFDTKVRRKIDPTAFALQYDKIDNIYHMYTLLALGVQAIF